MTFISKEFIKPIEPVVIGSQVVDQQTLQTIYNNGGEKIFPFAQDDIGRRNPRGIHVWVKPNIFEKNSNPDHQYIDIEIFPTDKAVMGQIFFRAFTHSHNGLRSVFFNVSTGSQNGISYAGFPAAEDLVGLSWGILNVVPIEQIKSQWWNRETDDNYRKYSELLSQGADPGEAALRTWEGINIAQRNFFFQATVSEKEDPTGQAYTEVIYSK